MSHKHQIWSSNKSTRSRAGRKWRRQDKQWLSQYVPCPQQRKRKLRKPRRQFPMVSLSDDDYLNDEFYCWHGDNPIGPGPYCTGCGGLIKRDKK